MCADIGSRAKHRRRAIAIVFFRHQKEVADSSIRSFIRVLHHENCDSFAYSEKEYDFSIDSVRLLMTSAQDESSRLLSEFFLVSAKVEFAFDRQTVKGFNLRVMVKGVQCDGALQHLIGVLEMH